MRNSKVNISKYMSYLLRHNPEDLKMDAHGFVSLDKLLKKLKKRGPVGRNFIIRLVEDNDKKRFEIVDGKIRAIYGHTLPVKLALEEDRTIQTLYHGTTSKAASNILEEGLKPMERRWVHLSYTVKLAAKVGLRRSENPVILRIDAESARKNGIIFYKATDKVRLSKYIPPKYIHRITYE